MPNSAHRKLHSDCIRDARLSRAPSYSFGGRFFLSLNIQSNGYIIGVKSSISIQQMRYRNRQAIIDQPVLSTRTIQYWNRYDTEIDKLSSTNPFYPNGTHRAEYGQVTFFCPVRVWARITFFCPVLSPYPPKTRWKRFFQKCELRKKKDGLPQSTSSQQEYVLAATREAAPRALKLDYYTFKA